MTTTRDGRFRNLDELVAALPADFLWGSATSSYQIEGAIHEDGRGPSIWDEFCATPGKVYQGETGAVADDHYHKMPEDVALLARLGLNAYRFSIAWPRILPEGRGTINAVGLDFYDRLVDTLLSHHIKPFVTLYHWDLPLTLEQQGGWRSRETAYAFADYAEIVARKLGDRVQGWITLNEPWCSAYLGYGNGVHAPGIQDRQAAIDAAHHLLLAHGLAVPRLRASLSASTQVGITLNLSPVYPANERPETLRDVALADAFSNRWFLDPLYHSSYPEGFFGAMKVNPPPIQDGDMQIIAAPTDFLGINNYSRAVIDGLPAAPTPDTCQSQAPVPGACYTEMAWEVYPRGLHDLLLRLHHDYHIPALYITENGAAFADEWDGGEYVHDPRRVEYYHNYIQAALQAREEGVPLRGYFAWSLMDNFEWAEGYSKRFGIIYVDYPTQRRIIKDSGLWYAEQIKKFRLADHL